MRALILAAQDVLNLNAKLAPVDQMFVLVVCGHGKNRRSGMVIPSNWHDDQAMALFRDSFADMENWQKFPFDHAVICDRIAQAMMMRCETFAAKDAGFQHAAIAVMHPEGATCLGFMRSASGRMARDEIVRL